MKILLVGNSQSYLAKRLEIEAESQAVEFTAISLQKINFTYSAGRLSIKDNEGRDLSYYDCYFFYGLGQRQGLASILARGLSSLGKRVIEPSLTNGALPNDKMFLDEVGNLNTVPYQFFFRLKDKQIKEFHYPLIAKLAEGSCGSGVKKINSSEEMKNHVLKFGRSLIIQDYLPIQDDYRVLVIGSQAIGAIKRTAQDNHFLTTKPGGKRETVNLPDHIIAECVRAVQQKGLTLAGVDLVEHQGEYYIFEINSSPQIRIFEKVSGINAAGEILKYLMKAIR